MKVAFDGRAIADRYPGIGRYAYGLARALAAMTEVTLIVNPDARNTRFDLSAIPAQMLRLNAGPASLAAQWRVPHAVARSGAQVYHSPYFLMPYVWSILRVAYYVLRITDYELRIPSVVTLFDLTPLRPEAGYGAATRLAIRLAHQLAARTASRVIVLSRWGRDSLATALNLRREKMSVIAPGIDSSFRPRPPAEVEAVRSRLGLLPGYLLYVGTLRPHKNLPRLIEAFCRLPSDSPPLVIAGHAETRYPQARAQAATLPAGRVCFVETPAEADLPALYSGASLFVFPSLAEGFGLPVLEAMACGAPVACSNAPGLDEAAGPAAARFDPLNVDDIAETLSVLLRDRERRAALGERALAHSAAFTWERAAEETRRVYVSLL